MNSQVKPILLISSILCTIIKISIIDRVITPIKNEERAIVRLVAF
ncbi:hypothetical protein LCGC14_0563740 [marine sediment metagenome]|uniref:Uncharacterized protein n=1 Tax=marine sediment metagenome TaxID=412755 RepID=A0A0F9UUK3_9ZZZZ|nr:MAG: hypothetical protein Lokiarch_04490 [Candidatus Lokiarchaeum sp. GC14_75]